MISVESRRTAHSPAPVSHPIALTPMRSPQSTQSTPREHKLRTPFNDDRKYVARMKHSVVRGFSAMVEQFSPYFASLHTGYVIRSQSSRCLVVHGNASGRAIELSPQKRSRWSARSTQSAPTQHQPGTPSHGQDRRYVGKRRRLIVTLVCRPVIAVGYK